MFQNLDPEILEVKSHRLNSILEEMGSLLVAFSGGVDSTFLLGVTSEVLGDKVSALTATSPTYPAREFESAKRLAAQMGVNHVIVESNELLIPNFADNPNDRCYYCKSELFDICRVKANELGLAFVADGSNTDDLDDYRPGRKAAQELCVRSPLVEAGLSKEEIRYLSCKKGFETWDKPAFACLSSRFPYGTKITKERLERVAFCEDVLCDIGLKQFRVRYHGDIARIEVEMDDLAVFLDEKRRMEIVTKFKESGFIYITIDLQGYRQGSMNIN